jgi:hypothetical protein
MIILEFTARDAMKVFNLIIRSSSVRARPAPHNTPSWNKLIRLMELVER